MNNESAAVYLALALRDLFPNAHLLQSGSFEENFYLEFCSDDSISEEILAPIEERMFSLSKKEVPYRIHEMVPKNGMEFLRHLGQKQAARRMAQSQPFVQIFEADGLALPMRCSEEAKKKIVAFKLAELEEITPGKWRVRGVSFSEKGRRIKGKNHRELGRRMELFTSDPSLAEGVWMWHPKGALMRQAVTEWFEKAFKEQGYLPVCTQAMRRFLSGRSASYAHTQGPDLHAALFNKKLHSYRELPVKYYEFIEKVSKRSDGELLGLFAARIYETDLETLFCSKEQALQNLISSLQFFKENSTLFSLECKWSLCSRGKKYAGTQGDWTTAEGMLLEALKACEITCIDGGDDSYLGPGLEIWWIDRLGRKWRGPFLVFDFYHPEQFGLRYQGKDGELHIPFMLIRSSIGSFERALSLILEKTQGGLPFWLKPEQVRVAALDEEKKEAAEDAVRRLQRAGVRAFLDHGGRSLSERIHLAKIDGVSYLVLIGKREQKRQTVAVRDLSEEKTSVEKTLDELIEECQRMENKRV